MNWGAVYAFCANYFWRKVDNIYLHSGQVIRFGAGSDFSAYQEGTWTPAVTGGTSNPTVAYTTQTGTYTRIGNVVFYTIRIVIDTYSGGSGTLRISLPVAVGSAATNGVVAYSGVDLPASTTDVSFAPTTGAAYGTFLACVDDGAFAGLAVDALAAGDTIRVSGFYFV